MVYCTWALYFAGTGYIKSWLFERIGATRPAIVNIHHNGWLQHMCFIPHRIYGGSLHGKVWMKDISRSQVTLSINQVNLHLLLSMQWNKSNVIRDPIANYTIIAPDFCHSNGRMGNMTDDIISLLSSGAIPSERKQRPSWSPFKCILLNWIVELSFFLALRENKTTKK